MEIVITLRYDIAHYGVVRYKCSTKETTPDFSDA